MMAQHSRLLEKVWKTKSFSVRVVLLRVTAARTLATYIFVLLGSVSVCEAHVTTCYTELASSGVGVSVEGAEHLRSSERV